MQLTIHATLLLNASGDIAKTGRLGLDERRRIEAFYVGECHRDACEICKLLS